MIITVKQIVFNRDNQPERSNMLAMARQEIHNAFADKINLIIR